MNIRELFKLVVKFTKQQQHSAKVILKKEILKVPHLKKNQNLLLAPYVFCLGDYQSAELLVILKLN